MSDSFRALGRKFRRVRRRSVEIALPKLELEGLVVAPDLLHARSVVYSACPAVSAFDRALADRFGCTVHSLEHTPRVQVSIELPSEETSVVTRMHRSMRKLGHRHIDLLRLDVEGAEYEAIDAISRSALRPCQLLVDFHHHLPHWRVSQTERALRQLSELGYRIFDRQPSGQVYSLALV
ncbi:MAG TPA: FkbM family methyltransferase [Polyangiales bacterium]|nr:FkbM family methyltransferase [Polyangiales bacterium]